MRQYKHDGAVEIVCSNDPAEKVTINSGDMVMLLNWYRYVKRNNIQDDFINPDGKRG